MKELIDYTNNFTDTVKEIGTITFPNESMKQFELLQILERNHVTEEEFGELSNFFKDKDTQKMLSVLDTCQTLGMDPSGFNSKIYFASVCANVQNLKGVKWQDIIALKQIYDKYKKEKQLETADTKIYEGKSK